MKRIPVRYRDHFRDLRVKYPNFTWAMCWQCRRCGQVIKKNAAGAQSHLAKHVREVEQLLMKPTQEEQS